MVSHTHRESACCFVLFGVFKEHMIESPVNRGFSSRVFVAEKFFFFFFFFWGGSAIFWDVAMLM